MTREHLDTALDQLHQASATSGDSEAAPGLITIDSSEWVGGRVGIRVVCASLQDGMRYRDIQVHVSSQFRTEVLSRAQAGERGAPYRDLQPPPHDTHGV